MKVLVVVERSPIHRYLINLHKANLVKEVKDLINRSKYSEAVAMAFLKGDFERQIYDDEVHALDVDLILSENTANWDLT